ncbi:hypothetical protein ACWPX1_23620 [Pseudomonas aeruginosa]|uniref:hypothetical protein n=1 Tax=Pseudomonas aeruginosa TaxID=287 RepID=UPI000F889658|nr:hypothetical protein [Pseudomonas aeruginosa]EKU5593423.1 hypothetical protein [Pseudomonas aeruginosa]EKY1380532.1 hypothetical protein [Pseudomonas aeruginosa]EKY1399616.1 hypothetical protein [Pseudomonas aeruginosa]MBQ0241092.1 hypothetical protein [Pseudomonas aeruginosa]MBQ0296361.1 hypothetical protein [Pseudomonas aeruginosa]
MDEPLFNELLESVKQADQIMTDHAELRRLAEEVIRIERSEDEPISSAWELFDSAANPKAILALLDEIDGLSDELSACTEHPGGCGYWREAAKRRAEERDRLRAQNDALRGALHAVQAEVDGNLRPLTRDLVNMVSGLNNGTHPNDIYDHCDEIERIIDAALKGATQ